MKEILISFGITAVAVLVLVIAQFTTNSTPAAIASPTQPVQISMTPTNPETIANKPNSEIITTASGLKYQEITIGTGAAPKQGNKVTVHYIGTLEDGTKFDSSRDRGTPFSFLLGAGRVIKGWDRGVAGMKVGGQRVLIIPAEMAYGTRGAGNVIPPNAALIFDVELLGLRQGSTH